jgi:hypothetical protein
VWAAAGGGGAAVALVGCGLSSWDVDRTPTKMAMAATSPIPAINRGPLYDLLSRSRLPVSSAEG